MTAARPGGAEPLGADERGRLLAGLLARPGPVLLAVSGGPDSTALMGAAAGAAADGTRPVVATVDHGLRPASRGEAEAVGAAARGLGLEHHVLTWTRRDGESPSQAGARAARYRLLGDLAERLGCRALATAHTQDDQAETVLLRLAAGSGLSGLAAMRPVTRRGEVEHHRPFLGVPKARLMATCRAEGWPFVTDPTNADPRHARPRWRGLMPALAAEGLDAARLARLAGRLRRADDALERIAAEALAQARVGEGAGPFALDLRRLAAHPDEIVLRVLARALAPDATMRLERLETCAEALLAACRDGRSLRRTLANRLLALDRGGCLVIAPEPPRSRGRVAALTLPAADPPHSLGIGGERA